MPTGETSGSNWRRAITLMVMLSLVSTACSWLNNEVDEVGCAERPEGLTNWWQLNEIDPDPGIEHLDFASGVNGFDGDLSPSLAPAKVKDGAFADFGGSIDFAGGTSVLPSSEGFAVDAWVALEGQDTEQTQNVLDSRDMASGGRGIWFGIDQGKVHLKIGDGANTVEAHGDIVPLDAWHFIAASYDADAGRVEFTMDDQVSTLDLTFPADWTGKIDTSTLGLHLHYGADTATQIHNTPARLGMDEIEFFDQPVSSDDFQEIFDAGPAGKCVSGIDDDPCITGTTLDDGTEYNLKTDFDLRAWWPFDVGIADVDVAAWNSQPPMNLVSSPYISAPVGKVDGALDVRGASSWAVADQVSAAIDFGPNDDFSIDTWIRFDEDNPWVLDFGQAPPAEAADAGATDRRGLGTERLLPLLLSTNPETQVSFAVEEVASLLDLEATRERQREAAFARRPAPALPIDASTFPNGDEFDGYVIAENNFLQNINNGDDGWLIGVDTEGELYFYVSWIEDGKWEPSRKQAFAPPSTSDPDLLDGDWHLIAITVDRTSEDSLAGTHDASQGHFFVDGERFQDFRIPTERSFENDAPITFGGVSNGSEVTDEWPGIIDEFEIFGVELPDMFIADLHDAGVNGKCKDDFAVVTSSWCKAEIWLEWDSMWPLVTDPDAQLVEDYDLSVAEVVAGTAEYQYRKTTSTPIGGAGVPNHGPVGYPNLWPGLQMVDPTSTVAQAWPPVSRYREQFNWDNLSFDTEFEVAMQLDALFASNPNAFLDVGDPMSGWVIGGTTWRVEQTNFGKVTETPVNDLSFATLSAPYPGDTDETYDAGVLPCEGETEVVTPTTDVPLETTIRCGELPGQWKVGDTWTFTASVDPAGTAGTMEVNFDHSGGVWETMGGSYTIDQSWSAPGAKSVVIRFTPSGGGDPIELTCGTVELEGDELQLRCALELDRPQVGFVGIAFAEVSPSVAGQMDFDFSDPVGDWAPGALSGSTWESAQHTWTSAGSKIVYARFTPTGGDPITVICEPGEVVIEPNEEFEEEEEVAADTTTTTTSTTSTTSTTTPVVDFTVTCVYVPKEGARVFEQADGTVFVPAGGASQSLGFEAVTAPASVAPTFAWAATQPGSTLTKNGTGQLYDTPYDPGPWQLSVSATANGLTETATCPPIEIDG